MSYHEGEDIAHRLKMPFHDTTGEHRFQVYDREGYNGLVRQRTRDGNEEGIRRMNDRQADEK